VGGCHGAWLGAIPAVILALSVSPPTAILAVLAYRAINQLEGNVLRPRIQGEAVRVQPLQIFLAGGEIAGLAGAGMA
jgi:predicted PurR-regulated permease PerM